jgi:hypothetical protein
MHMRAQVGGKREREPCRNREMGGRDKGLLPVLQRRSEQLKQEPQTPVEQLASSLRGTLLVRYRDKRIGGDRLRVA